MITRTIKFTTPDCKECGCMRFIESLIVEWPRLDSGRMPCTSATVVQGRAALRSQVSKYAKRIKLLRDEPWRAVEY